MKRFWEVEDYNCKEAAYFVDKQAVIEKFEREHRRDELGRFVVPLPWKEGISSLGESRSIAVRRFKALKRSLRSKSRFEDFAKTLSEIFRWNMLSKYHLQNYMLSKYHLQEGVKFDEQNSCCF